MKVYVYVSNIYLGEIEENEGYVLVCVASVFSIKFCCLYGRLK